MTPNNPILPSFFHLNDRTRSSLKALAGHLLDRWLEEGNDRFLKLAATPLALAHSVTVEVVETDEGLKLSIESDWLKVHDLEELDITETLVRKLGDDIEWALVQDVDVEQVERKVGE